jgi:hypothetical protein
LKKLHDLLVLKITQTDALTRIVGRTGIKWIPEVPVDRGWIDIYVPRQERIEQPYVIEVETGYDLNCSGILQKFERFRKALTKHPSHFGWGKGEVYTIGKGVYPKLCVVLPPDFVEFIPLFKSKDISVFVWEGRLEWKCKDCGKITSGSTRWRPEKCSSCSQKKHPLSLVGLSDFRIKEALQPA